MAATKPRRRRWPAIAAIDFEASSLPQPGSYPIEVAIAYATTGDVRSWLIRPARGWTAAGVWDPSSARIHGISRAILEREGQPADEVARELAAAVADHVVVTDSVEGDGFWLAALYAAAGEGPPFRLEPYIPVIETLSAVKGAALSSGLRNAEGNRQAPVPSYAQSIAGRASARGSRPNRLENSMKHRWLAAERSVAGQTPFRCTAIGTSPKWPGSCAESGERS